MHRKLTELHVFTSTNALIVHGPSGLSIGTFAEAQLLQLAFQEVQLDVWA